MVGFAGKFTQISFADTIRRWCRMNNLQARTALYVDCTNGGFAFSASPFPQLLANIYFGVVQLLFRGMACREFARISIDGIIRRWCRRNNLQARTALCVDCTNGGFAISASPIPQLLAHMWFALVQLLFRCRVCREIYANFLCRYYAAMVQDEQFASSYRFVR